MRSSTSTSSRSRIWLSLSFLAGCGGCHEATPHKEAGGHAAPLDAQADVAIVDARADVAPTTSSFDDVPDAGPSDLDARGKHLLEAIMENDPSLAADIVLPRDAWMAARDAQDPAGLYESKMKTTFAAQIARAHRHEKGIDRAVFVSFELGSEPIRVTPKHHEWKEALWRVNHSSLTFSIDDRVRRYEIAEMIAWRGHWYVARLR